MKKLDLPPLSPPKNGSNQLNQLVKSVDSSVLLQQELQVINEGKILNCLFVNDNDFQIEFCSEQLKLYFDTVDTATNGLIACNIVW